MKLEIGVIILAAGNSSRMGDQSKQLLKFQGKTFLRRAAETALRTKFSTVMVLGAKHAHFRKEIEDLPLKIAVNENWKFGLSSSIKKGLLVLAKDNLDAAIVMLCDQPLVTLEVLIQLRDAFVETKKPIVASSYENTIGVPALFARETFAELNDLQMDEGAKKIIVKDLNRTALIDVPEAAFDVDTLQDFENLMNQRLKLATSALKI
jgi:molybdenum cofactor cytidylyltransferase